MEYSSEHYIVEGRLKRPLYHGTSSLFLDSIKKYGLGGRNIIEELGVIKTLKRVVQLAEQQLKNNDNYSGLEWMYQNLVNQTSANQNWQHGQVYVSASKGLANQYALNPYGSELINETLRLYDLLHDTSSLGFSENPVLILRGENISP